MKSPETKTAGAAANEGEPDYLPHVARGATINFSGTIAHTLIAYGYTFMLARMLSADDMGRYFIILTIVNLLALGALAGLDMGVIRFVSLYAGQKNFANARRTLRVGLIAGIFIGSAFTAGLFFAAPKVADMFLEGNQTGVTGLRILAIAVPLLVAARLYNATTLGMHVMRYQVYSRDLGEQFAKFGFSALALAAGLGIIGVIYANLASILVALALSLAYAMLVLPKRLINTSKDDNILEDARLTSPAKALLLYSFPLAFANIIVAVWLQIDKLLLGYLGTTAAVAFYGVAMSLAIFSSKIISAFATVFSPMISDLWYRREAKDLEALFKTVTRWILMLTFPIFLVLVVFSDAVMRLFGSNYTAGAGALVLLAVGQFFNAATGACGIMIMMSGRSYLELINVAVTLIIDVALCFLLIPDYGIIGAAVANMTCLIVVNIMRIVEIWISMRMHAYDRSYYKPVLASAISAATLVIFSRYILTAAGPARLVSLAILLTLFYFLVLVALGLEVQDKALIGKLKGSILRFVRPGVS